VGRGNTGWLAAANCFHGHFTVPPYTGTGSHGLAHHTAGSVTVRLATAAALVAALLALVALPLLHQDEVVVATTSARPNVVVIMTDDQDQASVKVMRTVQRTLVARGVSFANSYVTTPECCPSHYRTPAIAPDTSAST
jgi:hypothetical protein